MENKNYYFIIILMYSEFKLPIIKLKEDVSSIICAHCSKHNHSFLIFFMEIFVCRPAHC